MAELKQTLLTVEGKAQLEAMLPTLIAQKREIKERLQGTKTYGDAAVETVSGKVEVQVPAGVRPRVVAHGQGRVRIDVPEGEDSELSIRTVSGSVRVRSG